MAMTRKFDQPFVQVTCWIPFRWMELWCLLKEHPQFQHALRDVLRRATQEGEQGHE